MTDTFAEAPAYSPDGVPVTLMTTGNVATPEEVLATRPMEPTVPDTAPAPGAAISTWSPSFIRFTTLASTLALTTSPVRTTVMPALLPPEPPSDPPSEPPPEPPPDPPPE